MIAGPRLRAGRPNSAKGAARMVAKAISTARAISADTTILVRGDSAFGSRAVVGTCIRHGAQFSVAMARNSAIDKTIAAIGDRLDPGPEQRPEDVGLLCQRLHHCRRSRRRETNRWDRWPRRGLNRWRDPDRTNTDERDAGRRQFISEGRHGRISLSPCRLRPSRTYCGPTTTSAFCLCRTPNSASGASPHRRPRLVSTWPVPLPGVAGPLTVGTVATKQSAEQHQPSTVLVERGGVFGSQ